MLEDCFLYAEYNNLCFIYGNFMGRWNIYKAVILEGTTFGVVQ